MKNNSHSFFIGIFFMMLGLFFLLNSFDILHIDEELAVSMIFFAGGVSLLLSHFLNNKQVWSLILGCAGIFIGAAIFIEETHLFQSEATGMLLFIIIGIVFLGMLKNGRKNWWAIIPGGFCLILAGHILLDMTLIYADHLHGVLFFTGIGLIFGVIWLLKNEAHQLDWAKYPGAVGFVMAALVLFAADEHNGAKVIFPLLLIILGSGLLYSSLKKQKKLKEPEHKG